MYARTGDKEIRAEITETLSNLAIKNAGQSVDVVLDEIVVFLRTIKQDRIQRASDWIRHTVERDAASAESHPPTDPDDTDGLFQDMFCDYLDRCLQVLWGGVSQQPVNDETLPFLVSDAFSLRLQGVVRKAFMPIILPKCRHLIASAEQLPTAERQAHLRSKMNSDSTRKELSEVWKYAWQQAMQEVELPKKPEIKPTGVFNSLAKAVQAMGDDDQVYTLEAWKEDVATAKMQQATVRELWLDLSAPSTTFVPPQEEDKPLLMNIFALGSGGLRSQISALRQIAQQSENIGRAFDVYAKGKDLQLALLAVSYQNPGLFLTEKSSLKDMLRGYSEKEKARDFPLLLRYLRDFI